MTSKKKRRKVKGTRKPASKKSRKPKAKPKIKARKKKPKRLSKIELLQRQVKYLSKRLKKYDRSFIGPLLPGQKRKRPSKSKIEEIRTRLKLFLEGIKRSLEPLDIASKYRSFENEDGSIDAEIRVPLEDSGDIEGTFIDIEDAGEWNSLAEFWLMVGINASGEEATGSPTIDKRPNRAWTNPVRGNRAGAAFFTARETVVKKLEQWGADFSMIVIRIFWQADNSRPVRPGH